MSGLERQSRGDKDIQKATAIVYELCDGYAHPDTGTGLPGLLEQAWNPSTETLISRPPSSGDGSSHSKPGSRPPTRLDLWAHVQTTLDKAREEADDLGAYTNGADGEKALRRIPALMEATLQDCYQCEACQHSYDAETHACTVCHTPDGRFVRHRCDCRHRRLVKLLGYLRGTLLTALEFQEERKDLYQAQCPECGRTGKISVRPDQERVWCRHDDCDFDRTGALAILAVAA